MKICSSVRLHLIKVCLETSGNHSNHEKRKSTIQEFDLQTSGLLSTVQGFDLKIFPFEEFSIDDERSVVDEDRYSR